jgi:hypothetical protein
MLFGRIELRETRAQNMGLQIISTGGNRILFDLIVNKPDFRAVVSRGVADEDDLEQRFVGFELNRVMELGNEGAQFFQEGDADLLEVLLGSAFRNEVGIDGAQVGDLTVESNGPRLRGDLPFGRAKENADVPAVNGSNARRNRFGFERMIDGREHYGAVGNVNDSAATGEVGDDFVFLGACSSPGREGGHKNQAGANEEVPHEGRVAQRVDCELGAARGMVPEWNGIR